MYMKSYLAASIAINETPKPVASFLPSEPPHATGLPVITPNASWPVNLYIRQPSKP